MSDVADRFAEELARAGCTLIVRAPGPVEGRCDRARIQQVVAVLLSNAAKFGRGRPIELALEARPAGALWLAVTDHGIGIAPDRVPHIFERFVRAVPVTNYGGLGLGLYIAHEIVAAHGGSIRAERAAGEGTRFIVELPAMERS